MFCTSRTHFRWYRGREILFSCVCTPLFVFDGSEGVGSRFQVLRAPTHFRRYRGHPIPFSCFALPDMFLVVPSASGIVFMLCSPGLIFWRSRGRRVPFSCFPLPEPFPAVPRVSGPVFMFCAPELIFGCTEGVGSRFHVLLARTHFRRYRGRQVPFSCFARPDSFSAVLSASGLIFMFCTPGLVFGGTEGVRSRFHVLHSLTRFRRFRGRRVPFLSFARLD
jgi:hypothetical protein